MAPSADGPSARPDSQFGAQETTDSDHESLAEGESIAISDYENQYDVDYWFGKKWFAYFLSQQLVSMELANDSLLKIDSLFEATTRNYQYKAVYTCLCNVGLARTNEGPELTGIDESVAVLVLFGAIMSRGSAQEQEQLKQVLRQQDLYAQTPIRIKSHQETPRPKSNLASLPAVQEFSLEEIEKPDRDLPRYTARLKERCDKAGDYLEYNYQETDDSPRKHRCILAFRDFTFEGGGSTKQRAKHEASKEACKLLKVSIR